MLFEFGDTLSFLCDNSRRCIGHKILVREFSLRFFEILTGLVELLPDPGSFRLDIDQTGHWHMDSHIAEQRCGSGRRFLALGDSVDRLDPSDTCQQVHITVRKFKIRCPRGFEKDG